jgi:hypothetical protein
VAIPHRLRLPGHLYFDGAAKARAGMDFAHENSPPYMAWRIVPRQVRPSPSESWDLWIKSFAPLF